MLCYLFIRILLFTNQELTTAAHSSVTSMYKHVEKRDYPQPKGVCEFVCAQWILKDSAHCYRQLNCSLVRAVWLPLYKHTHDPPTHRQRNDSEETLDLQKWGSNTTQPHRGGCWPLLQQRRLSVFSWHSITNPPTFSFYFFFHHFSHPQIPYHTLPSFPLPRDLCSFLCSNNTLLPLQNLSNSEGKLSFIHQSYICHSYYPPMLGKRIWGGGRGKRGRNCFMKKCHNKKYMHCRK